MRRRGLAVGCVAAALVIVIVPVGVSAAVSEPGGPSVVAGCLGVDPGANGPQIRVGFVLSGPDGLYRAVFAGPSGPVQGEGRVAGGRGLVIVSLTDTGDYDDLVLTNVDTGQSVERGPLGDALPLAVGDETIRCDPAALVAPTGGTTPEPTFDSDETASSSSSTSSTSSTSTTGASVATPPTGDAAESSTTGDAPPWLLLLIPGAALVIGGAVLLIRARSGSRSRPAT